MPGPSNNLVTVDPVLKTCTPDPVPAVNPNAAVRFQIASAYASTWSWNTQNPVVVTAPAGYFSGGSQNGNQGNGVIVVHSRNGLGEQGQFKYTVNLIKDGTTTTSTIDPYIENALENR